MRQFPSEYLDIPLDSKLGPFEVLPQKKDRRQASVQIEPNYYYYEKRLIRWGYSYYVPKN